MTDIHAARIERLLEAGSKELAEMGKNIACLRRGAEEREKEVRELKASVDSLRAEVSKLGETKGEHRGEIKRLWWAVNVAFVAAVGALTKLLSP